MKTQDSVKSKFCREHRCGRGSISNTSISHRRKNSWQRLFLISAATLFLIFGILWADDKEQTLSPRSVLENSAVAKTSTFPAITVIPACKPAKFLTEWKMSFQCRQTSSGLWLSNPAFLYSDHDSRAEKVRLDSDCSHRSKIWTTPLMYSSYRQCSVISV